MPVVVFVETADNNRGRFLAESSERAIEVLSDHYSLGTSGARKLARGATITTESHTLPIRHLQTASPRRQGELF